MFTVIRLGTPEETIAHLLRIVDEWPRSAAGPFYLLLTAVSTALSEWAWRLLRIPSRLET